ncbi:MAG: YcxB family protein [Acidobacteria bacterium]|nr:YcxB family protein [Acidobacteriota bacterium]
MTTHVTLSTELTPDEVRQGTRLNRGYVYWFNLFRAYWYSTVLLVVILWANIARVVNGQRLQPASVCLVLIPSFFLWFVWNRRSSAVRKTATQLSDAQASATADAKGINTKTSTGATSFVPWSDYSAWREGNDVFALVTARNSRILSKRGLGEADLEQLRSFFRMHIR